MITPSPTWQSCARCTYDMMKQFCPTVVLNDCVVPRLIVLYSRIVVPSPISTRVGSPLYLRSCGSPPRTERDVSLERHARGDLAAVADDTVLADDGEGADLDVVADLRAPVDEGGGVNGPAHFSRTTAPISASATTCPSTFATPAILHIMPRTWSSSSSKRIWSPGFTGRRHFTLFSDV